MAGTQAHPSSTFLAKVHLYFHPFHWQASGISHLAAFHPSNDSLFQIIIFKFIYTVSDFLMQELTSITFLYIPLTGKFWNKPSSCNCILFPEITLKLINILIPTSLCRWPVFPYFLLTGKLWNCPPVFPAPIHEATTQIGPLIYSSWYMCSIFVMEPTYCWPVSFNTPPASALPH